MPTGQEQQMPVQKADIPVYVHIDSKQLVVYADALPGTRHPLCTGESSDIPVPILAVDANHSLAVQVLPGAGEKAFLWAAEKKHPLTGMRTVREFWLLVDHIVRLASPEHPVVDSVQRELQQCPTVDSVDYEVEDILEGSNKRAAEKYKELAQNVSQQEQPKLVVVAKHVDDARVQEWSKAYEETEHGKLHGSSRLFMLLVGINTCNTVRDSARLLPVSSCHQNCWLLAEAFAGHFLDIDVLVLLDDQATRTNIDTALSRIRSNANAEHKDHVVVYFSGHGELVPSSAASQDNDTFGFVLPVHSEADKAKGEYFKVWRELEDPDTTLNKAVDKARHAMVLVDSCHSGVVDAELKSKPRSFQGREPKHDTNAKVWHQKGKSLLMMSACHSNEEAKGSASGDGSHFTRELSKLMVEGSPRVRVEHPGRAKYLSLLDVYWLIPDLAGGRHEPVYRWVGANPNNMEDARAMALYLPQRDLGAEEDLKKLRQYGNWSWHAPSWQCLGRGDELLGLDKALSQEAQRRVLVHGLSGQGKTTLVHELVRRAMGVEKTYTFVRWFTNANDTGALSAQMRTFAKDALNLTHVDDKATDDEVADAVKRALGAMDPHGVERGWLLVFDNAAKEADVARYIPDAGTGRVVVTSETGHVAAWPHSGWCKVEVGGLQEDDALAVMLNAYRGGHQQTTEGDDEGKAQAKPWAQQAHEDAVRRMVVQCGGHGLAVAQIGADMHSLQQNPVEYEEAFMESLAEIEEDPELLNKVGHAPVAAAIVPKVRRLREKHRHGAYRMMAMLALCDPVDVPFELTAAFVKDVCAQCGCKIGAAKVDKKDGDGNDLGDKPGSASVGKPVIGCQKCGSVVYCTEECKTTHHPMHEHAGDHEDHTECQGHVRRVRKPRRAQLKDASVMNGRAAVSWRKLLEEEGIVQHMDAEQGVVSMHRLIQMVVRYQEEEEDEQVRLLRGCVVAMVGVCPDDARTEEDTLLVRHLNRHLSMCLQWIVGGQYCAADLVGDAKTYGDWTSIVLFAFARTCDYLGRCQQAQELYEQALVIEKKHYGDEHVQVASTLVNLGNAYRQLGDVHKAKELYEQALAIKKKHYGDEHVDVARTMYNLGIAYRQLGDVHKAKELYEQALVIQKKHYGDEHVQVASTLGNLGNAYYRLGDVRKGKELYEQALVIQKKHYGDDHVDVARTMYNLGMAYSDVGDVAKAKELYEQALVIKKKHYGDEHVQVAKTLDNLGNAYSDVGDVDKAKELHEQALVIKKKHYGDEHVQVATALENLGIAYRQLGDVHMTKELHEQALVIKRKHYGDEHVQVATALENLGNAYSDLGNVHKAQELLEQALVIKKKHYGDEHVEVAETLWNLGSVYYKLGDVHKTKKLYEHILVIEQKQYGDEEVELATTLENMGHAYCNLGDFHGAKELYEQSLAIKKKHYGDEHMEVASTLNNISNAYHQLGDMHKAKELREHAFMIKRKHLGAGTSASATPEVTPRSMMTQGAGRLLFDQLLAFLGSGLI